MQKKCSLYVFRTKISQKKLFAKLCFFARDLKTKRFCIICIIVDLFLKQREDMKW